LLPEAPAGVCLSTGRSGGRSPAPCRIRRAGRHPVVSPVRAPGRLIGHYPRMAVPHGSEDRQTVSWTDPDRVDRCLGRIGRLEPRLAGEEVLRTILPDAPRSLFDLGCGEGRLAALVLEGRPEIEQLDDPGARCPPTGGSWFASASVRHVGGRLVYSRRAPVEFV